MDEEKTQDSDLSLEEQNFKVKFSRLNNFADYEASSCDVCCQKKDKFFPEGDEIGIQMMVCYGCGVKCHSYCYGITTVTKEESIKGKGDQKVVYFLCQKCRLEPKKQTSCVVCNHKKGALKKIENSTTNEWVHVTCGLHNGGIIVVTDYKEMKFAKLKPSLAIEKDKKCKTICYFCKSDVGLLKCFIEECTHHAHVYCTMKYVHEKELQGQDGEEPDWFVRLNYVQNSNFDITRGCAMGSGNSLNKTLKNSFNEISQALVGKAIFQEQIQELVNKPTIQKQTSNRKSRSNRRKQSEEIQETGEQQTGNTGEVVDEQTENNEQKQILLEIGNGILKENEILDEEGKLIHKEIELLGGEVSLECPSHRRQEVYCVCQKADQSEDFVQCELCNDWYHYSCVKFCKKLEESNEKYRCPMCDEWYTHKKKRLLKELASGKAESWEILVRNAPKFNLMDFISVMLFSDSRINAILNGGRKQATDSAMKEIVHTLSFIPLFSSKLSDLCFFKQRKNLHEALNNFLQRIQEKTEILKIDSAIEIQGDAFTVNELKFKKNEDVKKLVDEISIVYVHNQAKEKGFFTALKKQVNWLVKVHSQFFKKQEKLSPLLLNDLIREDDETIGNLEEYKYLDNLLGNFKNWNQKLVSLYDDTLQRVNKKASEDTKEVSFHNKMEIEEEDYIKKKYLQWRERIGIKPSLREADELIEEGRKMMIDCSQELKKLEIEKEEVDIWCQQLDEQDRNTTLQLQQKLKLLEKESKNGQIEIEEADKQNEQEIEQEKQDDSEMKEEKEVTESNKAEGGDQQSLNNLTKAQKILRNQLQINLGNFEILAKEMMTKVLLQIPRMQEIAGQMEEYEINQLKWERISEFIDDFEKSQKTTYTHDQVSLAELEEILESSLNLPIKAIFLAPLNNLIEECNSKKLKIQAVLNQEFDEKAYILQLTSIRHGYLQFLEEEKKLEERLRVFKELGEIFVEGVMIKKVSGEQLIYYENVAKSSLLNPNILSILEEKAIPVKELLNNFQSIISKGDIERENLVTLRDLDSQMRQIISIDFKKELDLIQQIERSNTWFRNLHKFIYHLTEESAKLYSSQRIQEIDLELEELLDLMPISECSVEILQKFSLLKDNFEILRQELFLQVKDGLQIEEHVDKRIQNILKNLSELCWSHDTEILLQNMGSNIIIAQINSIQQKALYFKIDQSNPTLIKVNNFYQQALQEAALRNAQEIENQRKENIKDVEEEDEEENDDDDNQEEEDEEEDEDSESESNDDDEDDDDDDDDLISGDVDQEPEDSSGLNNSEKQKYSQIISSSLKWKETVKEFLSIIREAKVNSQNQSMISFQQLKDVLQEGYQLLFDIISYNKSVGFMKEIMIGLEKVFGKIDKQFRKMNKIRDSDSINDSIKVENCIDISDVLIEYKVSLDMKQGMYLNLTNLVRKPFGNLVQFNKQFNKQTDVTYFSKQPPKSTSIKLQKKKGYKKKIKQIHRQSHKSQLKNSSKEREIEENSSQNNSSSNHQNLIREKSKRYRQKTMNSDFVYESKFVKSILNKKEDDRNDDNATKKQSSQQQQSQGSSKKQTTSTTVKEPEDISEEDYDSEDLESQKSCLVTDEDRKKGNSCFQKSLQQNQIFSKMGKNPFRQIENQIFGEFNKNRKKYQNKILSYNNLFIELINFPQISKKILDKNFSTITLDKLAKNDLKQIENSIQQQIDSRKTQQQGASSQQSKQHQLQQNQSGSANKKSALPQQQQQQQQQQQNQQQHSQQNKQQNSNNKQNNNQISGASSSQQNSLSASKAQNTSSSRQMPNLQSSKEPAPAKKLKTIDLLDKYLPTSQTVEPVKKNALSILLGKGEAQEQATASLTKSTKEEKDSSDKKSKHHNDHHHHHRHHSRRDRSKHRGDSSSPSSRRHNNSSDNINKKRKNQENFSDESDSGYADEKNKQQEKKSSKKYQDDSSKQTAFDPDAKSSRKQEKVQTPVRVSQVNKEDIVEIDKMLKEYSSDKIYEFEKPAKTLPKQSKGIQFNPDSSGGEEEEAPKIEQEPENKELEEEYQLDTQNPTLENQTSAVKEQSSPLKKKDSQESLKLEQSNSQQQQVDLVDEPIPEGCIVRICKCRVRALKNQNSLPASLFTIEPIKVVKQFPLIDTSKAFEIYTCTDFSQIKSYLEKQVNKSIITLTGWIELQNPKVDSKKLLEAVKSQDSKDKVSGFKINGMTFNVFTERLLAKTSFKFTPKPFNPDNSVLLPCIIYKKKTDPFPTQINQYKFVKYATNLQAEESKKTQSQQQQQQQILSPISSENEEEREEEQEKQQSFKTTSLAKGDSLFEDKNEINGTSAPSVNNSLPLKLLDGVNLHSLLDTPTEIETIPKDDRSKVNPNNFYNQPHHPQYRMPAHGQILPPYPISGFNQPYPPYSRQVPYNQSQSTYLNHPSQPPPPPLIPGFQGNQYPQYNIQYNQLGAGIPPPPIIPQSQQQQQTSQPENLEESSSVTKKDNEPIVEEGDDKKEGSQIEEEEQPNLDLQDIDFDFVKNLISDNVNTLPSESDSKQPLPAPPVPPNIFPEANPQNINQNLQQLIQTQRLNPLDIQGGASNYIQKQYPQTSLLPSQPPPPSFQQQHQQQWNHKSNNIPYQRQIPSKQYGNYSGNPNVPLPPTNIPSQIQNPPPMQQNYQGTNGRPYQANIQNGGKPLRFPPYQQQSQQQQQSQLSQQSQQQQQQQQQQQTQQQQQQQQQQGAYGAQMYNQGSSPINSQNFNKFGRDRNATGGTDRNIQGQGGDFRTMGMGNNQIKSHQFKNQFGSRQQAHYHRINQPYTAHNPIPFTDPLDQNKSQQQQSSQQQERSQENIEEQEY